MAFKDKATSDFVVGQVWAKKGADSYLIYQVWARLALTETMEAVERVTRLFPAARKKLVEDKANGTAVMNALRKKVPGLVPVEPLGGKIARAEAVSPFLKAGNVHVPTPALASLHPVLAFDVDALITEATALPTARTTTPLEPGAHDCTARRTRAMPRASSGGIGKHAALRRSFKMKVRGARS
jgi:predicted phage terminase large subunit-like protein